MGLVRRDESPVNTEKNGFPARIPDISLIVVPELPQFITSSGSLKPFKPLPFMIISALLSSI